METKPSLTIVGLAVVVISFVAKRFDLPLTEGDIQTTILTLVQVVGFVITYIGSIIKNPKVTNLGMVKTNPKSIATEEYK